MNWNEFGNEIVNGNGLVNGGMEMYWWMNCERILNGGNNEWMEINCEEIVSIGNWKKIGE